MLDGSVNGTRWTQTWSWSPFTEHLWTINWSVPEDRFQRYFSNNQAFDLMELVTVSRRPYHDGTHNPRRSFSGTLKSWASIARAWTGDVWAEQDFCDIEYGSCISRAGWSFEGSYVRYSSLVSTSKPSDLITHPNGHTFNFLTRLWRTRRWPVATDRPGSVTSMLSLASWAATFFSSRACCFFKSSCQDITSFIDVFPNDWTHLWNIFHPFKDHHQWTLCRLRTVYISFGCVSLKP